MDSPKYVRKFRTAEQREAQRLAARRRLGIPDGYASIYGVFVPVDLEFPLRNYACWVKQKRGENAAKAFIWTALGRGQIQKPTRCKAKILDRHYIYQPRANTVYRRIAELAARQPLCEEGVLLYGIRVPSGYEDVIHPHAQRAYSQGGRQSARWVICEAWAKGWPHLEPPGAKTSVDLELVETMLLNYATIEEVAEFLGVGLPYLKSQIKKRRAAGLRR